MSRPEPVAEVTGELSAPVRVDGDLTPLRIACAGLMDQLNARVRQLGLDTDDCVVERFAFVLSAYRPLGLEVPLESLTDPARITKSFREQALRESAPWSETDVIAISRLRLAAIRAPDFPSACERRS